MIIDLETEIRKNYLEVLQPFDEAQETLGAVTSGIADIAKESFDEYTEAGVKAQEEGRLGEFAAQSVGSVAKGAVQGVGGILGDVEKLIKGIAAIAQTPKGKSKLTAFGKALQQDTLLTNSEDMAKHLEKIGIISKDEMGFVEGAGEIFAPIGTAAKVIGKAGKVASSIKGK